MDTLDTMGPTRISRVEAVEDPEVNKALFQIYSNLINPLSEMEQTIAKANSAELKRALNEGKVELPLSAIMSHVIRVFPKAFVLVFIASFVLPPLVHVFEVLDLDILPGAILCAAITAVVSLLWCFVKDLSLTALENKRRKEAYEEAFQSVSELNRSVDEQVDRIKNLIQFVPPKYRFSNALRYFVESYQNSRVDNLKEAVNAYDTYYFRKQTAQLQEELLEQERQNASRLDQIMYNQLYMMGQLDGISRDLGW